MDVGRKKLRSLKGLKAEAFSFGCIICQKRVFTQPAQILYRARKTCSYECRTKLKALRAAFNAKWYPPTEGALRRRLRYSKRMDDWRKAVFERDDYICQVCKVRGGDLNADHIKPFAKHPDLRFELDNGRTLCRACHMETPTWGRPKKDARLQA